MLGSLILDLKGMRTIMLQLSGFYYKGEAFFATSFRSAAPGFSSSMRAWHRSKGARFGFIWSEGFGFRDLGIWSLRVHDLRVGGLGI